MLKARRGLASRIRPPGEYFCRIDVSALWSVIFVLSIMTVMVQTPHHGYFPDVPKSLHAGPLPDTLRDDARLIALTRDGRYFFGGTQITLGQMAERIRAAVADGAEQRVFLTVDQRLKYRNVKGVADEIRRGGVGRVSFLTK
jgi:biopolymer transport protein ExbD